MDKTLALIITLLCCLLLIRCSKDTVSPVTSGTGNITGRVTNATGDSTVAGALVNTNPPTFSVSTDSTGQYSISNIDAGVYTVSASWGGAVPGNVAIRVYPGRTTTANIHLAVQASTGTSTAHLVAWWPLDEGSGTIAHDMSGHGHDGTLSSGVTWVPGGLTLNGGNNSVNFDDTPFRLNEGSWQVVLNASQGQSGWFMTKDNFGNQDDGIMTLHDDGTPHFMIHSKSLDTPIEIYGPNPISFGSDDTITAEWGSRGMKLFVNSQFVASNPYSGPVLSLGRPLSLGINIGDPVGFNGIIKDLKVYDSYLR